MKPADREADPVTAPADPTDGQPNGANETRPGGPRAPGVRAAHPGALGGYRIERLLGEGGMGAVYLARDDKLGRAVAIKTMRPELAGQPVSAARFLREARAAAGITHDNVIPILHVGEDAGVPYIVMPLLEGEPLDRVLKREPVCTLGVALKVGREVAEGLVAAHARGLIHRDIKPANIWIEGDPAAADAAARFRRTKILDFGLARPDTDDTQVTGTGAVIGTPAYMSPEQARGEAVDARTDLFSLGVVLYQMATGHKPFTGNTALAVLTSLAVDQPPPPAARNPQVPAALSDLIMRLLEKNRDARPSSAAEVVAALREIIKQVAAARKAARQGPLPVVVPLAQPDTGPSPWAAIDATEPDDDEGEDEATEALTTKTLRAAKAAPQKPPGWVWVAVGLLSLMTLAAVGVIVVKITRPDGKETTLEVPEGSTVTIDGKGNPTVKLPKDKDKGAKAPAAPRTDPDFKAAEWALSVGGKVMVREVKPAPGPGPAPGAPPFTVGDTSFVPGGVIERWDPRPGDREATSAKELPAGEFRVVAIGLGFSVRDKATDAGLSVLKNLTELAWLDLFEVPVTDEGLAHLAGLKSLR